MTRALPSGRRIWVLSALVAVTVISGLTGFISQNVPILEAAYQTAALFFGPYSAPEGVTITPVLAVARITGLATSITAVLAIYIAVTGTSLRTWGRRIWGNLTRRHGHIIVLTDQPAAVTASRQRHVIQISTVPQPGSHAVAPLSNLAAVAIRERAMHSYVVLIATHSFTDAVSIATELRDHARTHRHDQVLLLIQANTPEDITLLRDSALHDHEPLPVDAFIADDVYAAALVRALEATGRIPSRLAVAADPAIRERINAVLRFHHITIDLTAPLTTASAQSPLAVIWRNDTETSTAFALSTSTHEPKWCITGPQNRALAEDLGYRAVIADPADMNLTLDASTIYALARHIHDHYLATNPASHLGPWHTLDERLKSDNHAQAARIRTALREQGYQLIPTTTPHVIRLPDRVLEQLARAEHEHWMEAKVNNGWVHGPRNDRSKAHPLLVPWRDLPEIEKEKNRQIVRAWPELLAAAGTQPVEDEPSRRLRLT